MGKTYISIIIAALATIFAGCIEDGFTTSPSDQPAFSVDTLDIGLVYTGELTETSRFIVYNNHNKGINISSVTLSGPDASLFRLNVDGLSGRQFSDVEIRANDSIFVFVEANLPENGLDEPTPVSAAVNFTVNGVTSHVTLAATGQDITRLKGLRIDSDATFTAGKPYRVIDSLIVAEGATLTLEPGTRLYCHDKTSIVVNGTLIANGTAEKPVIITGDRTGDVIPDVSFDLMSRQWDGIVFNESSMGNRMAFTEVSNTSYGVALYGYSEDVDTKKITLENCKLRNSGECVLVAINASVEAYGCEFAEASSGLVYMLGGNHRFDQCTAANYYLFSGVSNAAWTFVDPANTEEYADAPVTRALITNCITYGMGGDVEPGDLTGYDIFFKRCSFKSTGTDDDNFIDSLWDCDPRFFTVREKYIFDYRLQPESPAIGAAYPDLSEHKLATDFYGTPRLSDLGAYQSTPQ